MVLVGSFNTIKYSPYETLKEILKQKGNEYGHKKHFIDETQEIIEKNPFKEGIVELLLKEGWTCNTDGYVWSTCDLKKKKISIDNKLISNGKIYDFYERDIHLIHELHHAWYSRFKLYTNQKCLTDDACSFNEFENRIMNEIISRENRAKPWILKKAVESFDLEPQIYDVASRMAFENNPEVEISLLAIKNPSLLKKILMDGPDNHYYKIALEDSLNNTPNEFWEKLFKYEDIIWERTLDFLMDKKIIGTSPVGNYALVEKNKEGNNIVVPCLDIRGEYYIKNKKDAMNYANYFKEKKGQDLKLVKIQEVQPLSKEF